MKNKAPAAPESNDSPHRCPGCDCELKHSDRYPEYFCQACLCLATDGDGRRLQFGNTGLLGGYYWAYDDEPDRTHENGPPVKCLILDRPVMVTEARFGGIVAQPIDSKGGVALAKGKVQDLIGKSQ